MELSALLDALARPEAFPYPVAQIEVRQTHISIVFLAGSLVYKIKKPVNFGWVDFATLEKRLHFCQEEVRLNRRLAPDVYLGVVPVARTAQGLQFESTGEIVEWAVKMQRLPESATLHDRLQRDEVGIELVQSLAGGSPAFTGKEPRLSCKSTAALTRWRAISWTSTDKRRSSVDSPSARGFSADCGSSRKQH